MLSRSFFLALAASTVLAGEVSAQAPGAPTKIGVAAADERLPELSRRTLVGSHAVVAH
mgnify:CR=1 FL=1